MSDEDFYNATDDPAHTLRPRSAAKTTGWLLIIAAVWAGVVFAAVKFPAQFQDSALGFSRIVILRQAVMGDARSESAVGDFNFAGLGGVKQNYAEALSWHRKAADQGFAHSETMLGLMYEHGNGVPVDNAVALAWYRKGAAQGNPFGEFCIGRIYYNGTGVPKNFPEAFKWMDLSANHGFTNAQISLGNMYRDGSGVAPDNVQAYKWYLLAKDGGNAYRGFLAPKMSPAQIAEAKRLAALWKQTPVSFEATP